MCLPFGASPSATGDRGRPHTVISKPTRASSTTWSTHTRRSAPASSVAQVHPGRERRGRRGRVDVAPRRLPPGTLWNEPARLVGARSAKRWGCASPAIRRSSWAILARLGQTTTLRVGMYAVLREVLVWNPVGFVGRLRETVGNERGYRRTSSQSPTPYFSNLTLREMVTIGRWRVSSGLEASM